MCSTDVYWKNGYVNEMGRWLVGRWVPACPVGYLLPLKKWDDLFSIFKENSKDESTSHRMIGQSGLAYQEG